MIWFIFASDNKYVKAFKSTLKQNNNINIKSLLFFFEQGLIQALLNMHATLTSKLNSNIPERLLDPCQPHNRDPLDPQDFSDPASALCRDQHDQAPRPRHPYHQPLVEQVPGRLIKDDQNLGGVVLSQQP
jgi:hypothetical protein